VQQRKFESSEKDETIGQSPDSSTACTQNVLLLTGLELEVLSHSATQTYAGTLAFVKRFSYVGALYKNVGCCKTFSDMVIKSF